MTVSVVEGALGILEIMPDSSALAIRDGQAADDIYYSLARTIADLLAMVAPSMAKVLTSDHCVRVVAETIRCYVGRRKSSMW